MLALHEPVARRLHGLLRLPARDERVPVVHALRPALAAALGRPRQLPATCSTGDPQVWPAVKNTLWFIAVVGAAAGAVRVRVALMLTRARRGAGFFRTVFYLPALAPPVAATLGFVYLLNPVDRARQQRPRQARDRGPALVPVARVVEAVARAARALGDRQHDDHLPRGVLDVPRQLYESAELDGAGAVPAAALGHAAVDQPRDPVRGRDRRDPRRCSTSRRRTSRRASPSGQASQAGDERVELGYPEDSTLFYPVLLYQHGLPVLPHGLRVGAGDGPARRRVRWSRS